MILVLCPKRAMSDLLQLPQSSVDPSAVATAIAVDFGLPLAK